MHDRAACRLELGLGTGGGIAACRSMIVTIGANVRAAQDAEAASAASLKPMFVMLHLGSDLAFAMVVSWAGDRTVTSPGTEIIELTVRGLKVLCTNTSSPKGIFAHCT